ncbi:MAG TPA: class I SAM-dependent methyltransferase [Solirubrobacterales bacterium]|jgi:predicted O-methyltransferase YrrM|nr:class I SAM-dependent methyltransferase [Solirubrobacterales bacterium]
MRPAALAGLVAEVRGGRRQVLECGSGVSTIVLGRALGERGGHLHALEHDPGWASVVVSRLERERLGDTVDLIEAPLRPHPVARDGTGWYEEAQLERVPAQGIDLLLVDGPPAGEPGLGLSRYPALQALAERLTRDAIVVLDDIDRPGEAAVLDAWERETAFRFERRPTERIAVGRRTS